MERKVVIPNKKVVILVKSYIYHNALILFNNYNLDKHKLAVIDN